jgi:hypothetical protein
VQQKIHRQNGSNEKHARTREEHDELLAENTLDRWKLDSA